MGHYDIVMVTDNEAEKQELEKKVEGEGGVEEGEGGVEEGD